MFGRREKSPQVEPAQQVSAPLVDTTYAGGHHSILMEKIQDLGLDDNILAGVSSEPITPSELRFDRGDSHPTSGVRDWVQLTDAGYNQTQYLDIGIPAPGVFAVMTATEQTEDSPHPRQRTWVALDSEMCDGRTWTQLSYKRSIAGRYYDPAAHIKQMWLTFRRDPTEPHPLAAADPERFGNVGLDKYDESITNLDAYPRTGRINFVGHKQVGDEVIQLDNIYRLDDPKFNKSQDFAAHLDPEQRANLLDTMMVALARHYDPTLSYDYLQDPQLAKDLKDKKKNSYNIKQSINEYCNLHASNIEGIVAAMLGAGEILRTREFISSKGGKKGVRDIDAKIIDGRLAKNRDEISQGIETTKNLKMWELISRKGLPALRWKAELINNNIASALGKLAQNPTYMLQARQQLALFKELGVYNDGGLVVTVPRGNEGNADIASGQAADQEQNAYLYYAEGASMPVAGYGGFVHDVALSILDSKLPNKLPGNCGSVTVSGPRMVGGPSGKESVRFVNAMDAHARFLRRALTLGSIVSRTVTKHGHYVDMHPTLLHMLTEPISEIPQFILAEVMEDGTLDIGLTAEYTKDGVENTAVFVRERSGRVVPRLGNIVVDNELNDDSSEEGKRYMVQLAQPLKAGEIELGGVGSFSHPRDRRGAINYIVKEATQGSGFQIVVGQGDTRSLNERMAKYFIKPDEHSKD